LNYGFIDIDENIVERTKCSIRNIFEAFGEITFRAIETACLLEVAFSQPAAIVATGGGAPIVECNRLAIRQAGTSIYLKTSLASLECRHRSLLESGTALNSVTHLVHGGNHLMMRLIFAFREPFYLRCADHVVDVTNYSIDKSCFALETLISEILNNQLANREKSH
jgi:shikimate kinase